jgi:hypothetical protein
VVGDVRLDKRWVGGIVAGMGLGTKNRQNETAQVCKEHLRETHGGTHGEKAVLVEEFIGEIEGSGKKYDAAAWAQFADASWKNEAMLKRVDEAFEKWLNP